MTRMSDDAWKELKLKATTVVTGVYETLRESTGVEMLPMADAPDTWEALLKFKGKSILPVFDGASDKTIYATPWVNYAGRYWHDMTHLALDADFTAPGEFAVAEMQRQVAFEWLDSQRLMPHINGYATAIEMIYADTVAQVLYADKHGEFPVDQESLIREYIESDVMLWHMFDNYSILQDASRVGW